MTSDCGATSATSDALQVPPQEEIPCWRAYLDGACSGNHQSGARRAGYGIFIEPQGANRLTKDIAASDVTVDALMPPSALAGGAWCLSASLTAPPALTNNRAELTSVIRLLELWLGNQLPVGHRDKLTAVMDSTYVVTMINEWLPGWRRRGYKKANGEPVLNADLVRALDRLLQQAVRLQREFRVEWVRAHQKEPPCLVPAEFVAAHYDSLVWRNWFGNRQADNLAAFASDPQEPHKEVQAKSS